MPVPIWSASFLNLSLILHFLPHHTSALTKPTSLENDVEEELEGVAGGDSALGEGCVYEHVVKILANDLKPVCRVSCRLHQFIALLGFHPVKNSVFTIKNELKVSPNLPFVLLISVF